MIAASTYDVRPLSRIHTMLSSFFGFKPQHQAIVPPSPRSQVILLPPQNRAPGQWKKTLVLDLDETLIHSSLVPVPNTDFTFTLQVEGQTVTVYVSKRPGVDQFLRELKEKFELVVFTASIPQYADAVLDLLDRDKLISARIYRESCVVINGIYVKDLRGLGRDLKDTILLDNTPGSYLLQPQNGLGITSWTEDQRDAELNNLLPFLSELAVCSDVRIKLSEMDWQEGDEIFL
ncbi:carboxy-terminal domain RNA polymerase II polypeptide A small phosphatase 2 [Pelomyxa schiedti]|nr:carboxy-terminal domain RNA polymerase II polypeptide A small phosphatase 2 [Pelomyxa schiedti]